MSSQTPIPTNTVVHGDSFEVTANLPSDSIDTVVTSPPYWGQRDYGIDQQYGVEEKARKYVEDFASFGNDLADVITDDGSLWLVIDDSYNGCSIIRKHGSSNPDKGDDGYEDQLAPNREDSGVMRRSSSQYGLSRQTRMMLPARIGLSFLDNGWLLRDQIVWNKPDNAPEGRVSSRLTQSYEYIFRFVRDEQATFYRDRVDNQTNVWTIETSDDDHPAPFPSEIPRRAIELTTDEGDLVYDPFVGGGTTCAVANDLNRQYLGVDVNGEFVRQSRNRV